MSSSHPGRKRPTTSESDDKTEVSGKDVVRIQLGAESRKVLNPEDPTRDQPLMMKKKKKKKSLAARQSRATPKQDDPEKPSRQQYHAMLTKEYLDFFTTGDDVRDPRHDSYVIYVMRDFVIYLIFMIVTSIAIFGSYGTADNYFANVLADLVVKAKFTNNFGIQMTFYEITHRRDMWIFINDVLIKLLYESSNYTDLNEKPVVLEGYIVNLENNLFGAPQMRQIRVKGGTCESAPIFKTVFDNCADYYSEATEDTSTFGMNKSAWIYKPPTQDHVPVVGVFSTYGGGGFSMNLARSKNFTKIWIQELEREHWVRFGTRAIIIDFNLLNTNTQLFCAAKLVFEMPPSGGIVPNAYFTTVKLIWYSGSWGFFLMSCQIVFIAFVIFYTYEEISQIYRLKFVYLWNWWNALDITILLCSYVTIGFAIKSIIFGKDFLKRHYHVIRTYEHASFDSMVLVQSRYRVAVAILAFFVWVKILKFSTLNRTVCVVLTAFAKVRSELITATFLMGAVIFGFALLGMCIAGHLFQQLSAVGSSVSTLIGLLGGGIHFFFAHNISEFAFRAWLLLYIIACIVIFINIYVALIVHGFEIAQNQNDDLTQTAQFTDVLREIFCQFLFRIRKDRIAENIYEREFEKQNNRVYLHLAGILSRHGFDRKEIGLIFTKHNVHNGKTIPIETMEDIYEEMNVRNQLFVETEGHNQITQQLEKISRNVEEVDQTVMSVMTKVDTLTNTYLTDNVKK